jgi:outer membrane protein assembly factor BamB
MMPEDHVLNPGDILQDRYRIVRLEKAGGFGAVYKAEHVTLEIPFAIKELSQFENKEEEEMAFDLFKKEARTLATLNHPMIVKIMDFFNERGSWYFVMEYVSGQTLGQILDNSQYPLSETEVTDWAINLCTVMDYLHTRVPPVVFRDLNPNNIMVTLTKGLMLIDFGISREHKLDASSDTRVLGTPGYASPEQYGTGQSDSRSDIYGLGMTLFVLLTKKDPREQMFSMKPVSTYNAHISKGLDEIILKCLKNDPAERYQNVMELRRDLLEKAHVSTLTQLIEKVPSKRSVPPERSAPPERSQGLKKWTFLSFGSIQGSPTIGLDGNLYFGSTGNVIHALSPAGEELWKIKTDGGIHSSPAIDMDGTVYVGSWDKNLYAISPRGDLIWKFTAEGGIRAGPVISPTGIILICSRGKKLYALNRKGEQLWQNEFTGWIDSSPAMVLYGVFYLGCWDGALYCIDIKGDQKWAFQTDGPLRSTPALSLDGTIYIGSADKCLYAVYPNGRKKWLYATGGEILTSPVITMEGNILISSMDKRLYCISPWAEKLWEYEAPADISTTPLVTRNGTIYFGCMDNRLYALDRTGSQLWSFEAGDKIVASPNVAFDGTIYFGSDDGRLYALYGNEPVASSSWPMFAHDPLHTSVIGINFICAPSMYGSPNSEAGL